MLALIFVAWQPSFILSGPMGRKEENKAGARVYSHGRGRASGGVSYGPGDRELAPLFGHREELAVTAERDSLLVLPEDRRLPIRIQYGDEIETLQYEIRTPWT